MHRSDSIGFGGLELFQDPDAFCYGIDSVLAAGFAARSRINVRKALDMGTGNGIIPLILSHKTDWPVIMGIEIQKEQADLARQSIERNGLEQRIGILCMDVKDARAEDIGKYDLITCNPPYMKRGSGMMSSNTAKMTARHETTADIGDFMNAAAELLADKGEVVFVYRPSRLSEIMNAAVNSGLSPMECQMVCPFRGECANIVLLRFKKGQKTPLTVFPELIVREADGEYSQEVLEIYEK